MAKKSTSAAVGYPEEDKKWRAEDALRTLKRAEEIKRDQSLMKDVEKCRREEMRALADIKVETAPKTMKSK